MVFDFGYRLRELREGKHMTQEQVANRLGLSKTTISGYENNIKTPSVEVLQRLAILFEVPADYLLGLHNRRMLCVDGLTESQRKLVQELIRELGRQ